MRALRAWGAAVLSLLENRRLATVGSTVAAITGVMSLAMQACEEKPTIVHFAPKVDVITQSLDGEKFRMTFIVSSEVDVKISALKYYISFDGGVTQSGDVAITRKKFSPTEEFVGSLDLPGSTLLGSVVLVCGALKEDRLLSLKQHFSDAAFVLGSYGHRKLSRDEMAGLVSPSCDLLEKRG